MLSDKPNPGRILKPREAACKLGCCRRTLYRWISAGILQKPIIVCLVHTGWRKSSLDAFLTQREAKGSK